MQEWRHAKLMFQKARTIFYTVNGVAEKCWLKYFFNNPSLGTLWSVLLQRCFKSVEISLSCDPLNAPNPHFFDNPNLGTFWSTLLQILGSFRFRMWTRRGRDFGRGELVRARRRVVDKRDLESERGLFTVRRLMKVLEHWWTFYKEIWFEIVSYSISGYGAQGRTHFSASNAVVLARIVSRLPDKYYY